MHICTSQREKSYILKKHISASQSQIYIFKKHICTSQSDLYLIKRRVTERQIVHCRETIKKLLYSVARLADITRVDVDICNDYVGALDI